MKPPVHRSIALLIQQVLLFVLVQAGYAFAGSGTTTGVIKPLVVESAQDIKYSDGEGADTSGASAGAGSDQLI